MSELTELFRQPWKEKYSYAACLLSATTGMRLGEIRALTRDRIKDDFIIVDRAWNDHEGFKSTKSGKTRYVPLHPAVKQIIENISEYDLLFSCNGSFPIDPRSIAKPLVKHMKESSIDYKEEHLSFHSFRHFFNTRLVASGVSGDVIRAAIGHESEKMTDHYLHLTPSDMRQISDVQTNLIQELV